jgi:hypothetical protein
MTRVIEAMHPEARVRVITDMRPRTWAPPMEYKTTATGRVEMVELPELEF